MGTLWIEKQQGRDRALASLDNARSAWLSPSRRARARVRAAALIRYFAGLLSRKAAYVFWMLRDLVGVTALSAALRAYDPAKDTEADFFERADPSKLASIMTWAGSSVTGFIRTKDSRT